MKHLRALALLALLAPAIALAQSSGVPECIHVEGVARWGADAYNHFVILRNDCGRNARCRVASNVNPVAQTVEVPAGRTVEVITFRGSPASEHTPIVSCELAR